MKTMMSALGSTWLQRFVFMALLALCFQRIALAQEKDRYEDLFEMPFEELMNLEVRTGTLTGMSASKAPVLVTSICAEEIAATPARNMPDILEIYIPGSTFVSHFNGPRIGMRGISGDQNYSFLLLVNGKNMNLKTSDGPIFEIQNRDMNDIEQIDIIRGPLAASESEWTEMSDTDTEPDMPVTDTKMNPSPLMTSPKGDTHIRKTRSACKAL